MSCGLGIVEDICLFSRTIGINGNVYAKTVFCYFRFFFHSLGPKQSWNSKCSSDVSIAVVSDAVKIFKPFRKCIKYHNSRSKLSIFLKMFIWYYCVSDILLAPWIFAKIVFDGQRGINGGTNNPALVSVYSKSIKNYSTFNSAYQPSSTQTDRQKIIFSKKKKKIKVSGLTKKTQFSH